MGVRVRVRRATTGLLAVVFAAVTGLGAGALGTATPAGAAEPIYGVDVSNWQGHVDWASVRASGHLFAFTKATEGVTFVDRTLVKNRIGMASAELVLRGLYHFAHPGRNSAAAEALHFLSTIGPLAQGEVPVLDLEVESGPGVGAWAAEWMSIVEEASGHTPILYSGAYYLAEIPTAALTRYPLWVAAWGRNNGNIPSIQPRTDRWDSWTFWQFTSRADVPGVVGNTDRSIFAGSVEELAALGQLRPAPTPPPADPLGDALRKGLTDLGTVLQPPPA